MIRKKDLDEINNILFKDFKSLINLSGLDELFSDIKVVDSIDLDSNRLLLKESIFWIDYLSSLIYLLETYLDQYVNVKEVYASIPEFVSITHVIPERLKKIAKLNTYSICEAIDSACEKELEVKNKIKLLRLAISNLKICKIILTKAYYKILANVNNYGSRYWNTIS